MGDGNHIILLVGEPWEIDRLLVILLYLIFLGLFSQTAR
jgi:hypothetical protein